MNTEEKAEKREWEPHGVVLQHLVILPPLLVLSGKGFKMQSNKKNILEQVSCQSSLSLCLMKAISCPGRGCCSGMGFLGSCPAAASCSQPSSLLLLHQPRAQGLGRILLPPFTRGTGKQSQPTLIKTKLKLLNLSYPFEIISLLLVGQSRAKAQLL